MRVVRVEESTGALVISDEPVPVVGKNEVLIRVCAAGVNRADLKQRAGLHPPPEGESAVLGLEVSGTVVSAGADVGNDLIGREVCALLAGGGYADYAVARADCVLAIPDSWSIIESAGFVEVAATVWSNVFMGINYLPDDWVLVHGGASGIGTMAIQVANALGLRIMVTVGSEAKVQACRELGADLVVNYQTGSFADLAIQNNIGFARILDHVGGPNIGEDIRCLALEGTIVSIGNLSEQDPVVPLGSLSKVRGTLTATSLRARSWEYKAHLIKDLRDCILPLCASGAIKPVVDSVFSMEEAERAHDVLAGNRNIGKVLLSVN